MISYILLAIFFGLWYYFAKRPSIPKGLKPLPSPKGSEFYFGHYRLLGFKPHETLTKWAKELNSEIYSIKLGRLNFIILNNDKVVGELIQKRGAIYSSRMDSEYYHHIITRGSNLGSCPYTDYYKKMRTISVGVLSPQKIEFYSPLIDKVTKETLTELIHASTSSSNPEPVDPRLYLRRTSLNVVLDVVFGTHTTSIDDPLFKRIDKFVHNLTMLYANANRKLEYFPILKYHPKNKVKQDALSVRDDIDSIFGEILDNIKSGKNKNPCAAREIYERGELEDYQIVHLFGGLVFAGTDTVASSITWLLAFLANNPSFQEPAHKELDALIPKRDRLPTITDSKSLPYIKALIREGQRVFPPTWTGVHHCVQQDDEYNGYYIPANSLILINAHAIGFDEKRHKNAMEFDPYRFINVEQSMASFANGAAEKRDHFSFGAGRRLYGKPIPIDLNNGTYGLTSWPVNYHVRFVPRYNGVTQLLNE
ncbi:9633_t:CDS:2 [Funneliformis caledonium]|uniref:9633_t:CDS:1 n=1 Tax=Funneliformis caledonium TaxID=1117310 RepID=A0A9N9CR57_9GLOM|nr:9633_t:CDS:2 [Funneliformis caledonium]